MDLKPIFLKFDPDEEPDQEVINPPLPCSQRIPPVLGIACLGKLCHRACKVAVPGLSRLSIIEISHHVMLVLYVDPDYDKIIDIPVSHRP